MSLPLYISLKQYISSRSPAEQAFWHGMAMPWGQLLQAPHFQRMFLRRHALPFFIIFAGWFIFLITAAVVLNGITPVNALLAASMSVILTMFTHTAFSK